MNTVCPGVQSVGLPVIVSCSASTRPAAGASIGRIAINDSVLAVAAALGVSLDELVLALPDQRYFLVDGAGVNETWATVADTGHAC